MEKDLEFNLQDQINNWVEHLKAEPSLTASDSEELKSHLLDLMDDLKAAGLDEEERFWVASKRIGYISEWKSDYRAVNNSVIQMQRSVLILGGVLVYFLLYYFTAFSSKLFCILSILNDVNGYTAVAWTEKYMIGIQLVVIIFMGSIYFLEDKTISVIEKIRMSPKHTLILLLTTFIFGIADTCLYPVVKKLMSSDISLRSQFIHIVLYFSYSFPLIICTGFIFLYFKNRRETGAS